MSLLAAEEASNAAMISGIAQIPPTQSVTRPNPPVAPELQHPPAAAAATANVVPSNAAAVSALASAFPALTTKVKLNGILKKKSD